MEIPITTAEDQKEIDFLRETERIKIAGLRLHEESHDHGSGETKCLHISEHPKSMIERAEQMAETFGLTPRQLALVKMAIAYHDTVIEYDPADPNNLIAMIRRHRGARAGDLPEGFGANGNEAKSARLLAAEMHKANERSRQEIFTSEEIKTAELGIEVTYPDAKFGMNFEKYNYYQAALEANPKLVDLFNELKEQGVIGPLFSQPHLEKPLEDGNKVPREVLMVALADLGVVGTETSESFAKEGDAEMRELYANLLKTGVMDHLRESDDDSEKTNREKVVGVFFGWLNSQAGFAAWQALRFEKIIILLKRQNDLTQEEETGLRAQFSHYIENIRGARDRAKNLKTKFEETKTSTGEKEAFKYLAQNLHYDI